MEVLFLEKRRRESSAFWKYCSRKNVATSQAHFGSTVPGKTSPRVKRILEVLFPEKTSALIAGERSSAGPILPLFIFIFPGIVLPFCYFSVVRKVPEKPVLFLPHPETGGFIKCVITNVKKFCCLWPNSDNDTSVSLQKYLKGKERSRLQSFTYVKGVRYLKEGAPVPHQQSWSNTVLCQLQLLLARHPKLL